MEDQLEQAIGIALQRDADASLKQKAFEYFNEVKESENGWQVCLAMFTSETPRIQEARIFSLQVIDSRLPTMGPADIKIIRDNLFPHLQRMCQQPVSSVEPSYMRNKLAQTFAFLFVMSYATDWPTFLDDIMNLMTTDNSPIGNALGVDMFLRILNVMHEEIGDNLIIRSAEQTKRNNLLKDLVRERGMAKLASFWMSILETYSDQNTNNDGTNSLNSINDSNKPASNDPGQAQLRAEIIDNCLQVIGGWVSWIDITLIVSPEYLRLLFGHLTSGTTHRLRACDTLSEIIAKKMKPSHKLELISLLNLTQVLAQITASEDIEFDERLAKLANIVGIELVHIADGTTTLASGAPCSQEEIDRSEQLQVNLMPTIFRFLENEYDDTAAQVLPYLGEYLQFVRRGGTKKKGGVPATVAGGAAAVSEEKVQQRRNILATMLNKIILKMKYDDDAEWTGGEDDSEAEFLELRTRLRVLQDQIASIDDALFIDGAAQIIAMSLDSSTGKKSWQDVELGLCELYALGEYMRSNKGGAARDRGALAAKVFQELFAKMVTSDVIGIDEPSIQLSYMELIVRHSSLFTAQEPQLLSKALEFFVSPLGVHNRNQKVRVRSWYLIYRFLKSVRHVVGDIAGTVVSSISPLLVVRAVLPPQATGDNDSEISADAAQSDTTFDAQLYLFELCGMLLSQDGSNIQQLTQELLQSIYSDIERCLSQYQQQPNDALVALQVHHDLMVIGTIARGFSNIAAPGTNGQAAASTGQPPKAAHELASAAQVILVVLDRMSKVEVVRDSARFAISRLLPLLRMEVFGEMSRLIGVLLGECKPNELGDFMSFLGQIIHLLQEEDKVFEMFGSLISPLMEKVFVCLDNNEASSGSTDEVIARRELKQAYLQLLFNILNNNYGAMFLMESNSSTFRTVMESLLHYAGDLSDTYNQKTALITLNKMMGAWGTGIVTGEGSPPQIKVFGQGLKVPGFDDNSMVERYTQTCWGLPAKPGYNAKDAQQNLILGEVALVQKTLFERRGDAYSQYLGGYLGQLGLPDNLVQEYITQLSALTAKDFRRFFTEFMVRIS